MYIDKYIRVISAVYSKPFKFEICALQHHKLINCIT